MIRKTIFAAAAVPVAVVMASWALPAQSATTLKLTTCLAKNHDQSEALVETFYDPINAKKTDLTLRYLGGPEVTPRKKQAPALKRGLIDLIMCPAPYYGAAIE